LIEQLAGIVPCQISKIPVASLAEKDIGTQWKLLSAVSKYLILALVMPLWNTRKLSLMEVLHVGSSALS